MGKFSSITTLSSWDKSDGDSCDIAVVALEDIGSVVLGASEFFVSYRKHANKNTNQEDSFLSIYPKTNSIFSSGCLGGSDVDPPHCRTGGLHFSFVGGKEALLKFGNSLKIVMLNRNLAFPQGRAEYVTLKF